MGGVQLGGGKGIGEMRFQSMGKMGKDFCPNFLQPLDKRNCNDGSRELIPIFHNPHRKKQTLSSGGGSYLRVPCRGVL